MRLETAQIRMRPATGTEASTREQAILARIETLPGLRHVVIGRNLAGSWEAGDYTLDLRFDPAPSCSAGPDAGLAAALDGMAEVDRVVYSPIAHGLRAPHLRQGIWRTLMFRVRPEAPDWRVRGLEQDLLRMPEYMPGILNWRLARVLSPGTWTHVWQQEFASADDLLGEYLMHPFHWGHVDRWFDPEFPEWTVQSISHAFCPLATSLIANRSHDELSAR
ncbi:Dabb family protein [Cupriavidus sp. NPDC089707]|uniref:Dabb family protein n=1 Tax=Cupriavidus sp. NPDC089707 TaxID=3363963 RepID=UPI00381F101A